MVSRMRKTSEKIDGRKKEFEHDERQWKGRWYVLRAALEAK